MIRGGKIIGTAAILSVAACGGEQGTLEIRPIKAPLAAGLKPIPFRIAEARGQFALGNVALALESFRTALREDPDSVDAMMGIAACYDQMQRFDLSRRHYEAALAVAPGDPQLLKAFAASLDIQGRTTEAASVRQEIRQRVALAAQNVAPQPTAIAASAALLAPIAAMAPPSVVVATAPIASQKVLVERPAPAPSPPESPAKSVQIAQVARIASPVPATPAIGRSVTAILPPARPVAAVPAPPPAKPAAQSALVATRPLPTPEPVAAMPPVRSVVESAVIMARAERDLARVVGKASTGPRLERLSLREVELITVPGPQWRAMTINRTQLSAVRFVPIQQAAMRPAGVRVLNAARIDKLAARTRLYLADRGWRAISIGDAPAVRTRSLILYPANKRRLAERLSAQFGFAIAHRPGAGQVTILLGRDAANDSALRAKG